MIALKLVEKELNFDGRQVLGHNRKQIFHSFILSVWLIEMHIARMKHGETRSRSVFVKSERNEFSSVCNCLNSNNEKWLLAHVKFNTPNIDWPNQMRPIHRTRS